MIDYKILIKQKGFDPSPVANGRIPDFANSQLYPGVLGTIAHEDWWDEQIDRCINGYDTGGIHIPGRYYYYLNFCLLLTLGRGYHYPDYVDLDLELFRLIDTAKKEQKGIIVPKKRRAGVSHKFVSVISHGAMFTPGGYKAGIVAGLDIYSKGFYDKFKEDNDRKPPEFRLRTLAANQDEWKAGYEIKTSGPFKKDGSFNTVYCRTANMNENVFKGEILNDCGFEECGEFNRLEKTYGSTKACFMKGMEMRGTAYLWACVCAGTKVWDNYGNLINIEDLKPENGILGYDGNGISKEEITYWQPPREKECVRITTTKGRSLECSIDHPVLYSKKGLDTGKKLKRKKTTKFVEAGKLRVGHQIAVIESAPIYGNKKMWEPRMIGWLIGDGTYGNDHSPRLFNCDSEVTNYTLKNFDAKVTRAHITQDGKLYEEIRLKGVCGKLRELGIYGQTKLNKRLPKDIHSYCKKDICEMLGGFFDTDGYVNNTTTKRLERIDLSASSYDLLFEVKMLLQKIGIHCGVQRVKGRISGFRNVIACNDYFRLTISDARSIILFRKEISFKIKYKQEKLEDIAERMLGVVPRHSKKINGIRFERIKSIEFIGMKPVYNLTAGTTNTYIANGIVTHNTGGKMSSAKDFKNMYAEALRGGNNFIPLPIYGPRIVIGYFIGSTDDDGNVKENCPNIIKEYGHLSREQILGCEDIAASSAAIMKKTIELQGAVDRQLLYDHYQDFPMNDREIFLNFSGNDFSVENLSKQSYEISLLMEPKYEKYNFDWPIVNGKEDRASRPTRRPATQNEIDNHHYVMCSEDALPEGYSNWDVGGIDSYNQDQSKKSKSLGAMVVLRRRDRVTGNECQRPIVLVRMRPIRKEIFYETCLKVSVYYNLKRNVLIDVAKFDIGEYFIKNDGTRYLAERPKSFESKDSDQTHLYGVALTLRTKPMMLSKLQTWVLDYVNECWFPMIIAELSDYDKHQTDSDWDAADALGIALMRISDMRARPESDEDAEANSAGISSPQWKEVNGRMVDMSRSEAEENRDANCFGDSMEMEGNPKHPPQGHSNDSFPIGDY